MLSRKRKPVDEGSAFKSNWRARFFFYEASLPVLYAICLFVKRNTTSNNTMRRCTKTNMTRLEENAERDELEEGVKKQHSTFYSWWRREGHLQHCPEHFCRIKALFRRGIYELRKNLNHQLQDKVIALSFAIDESNDMTIAQLAKCICDVDPSLTLSS